MPVETRYMRNALWDNKTFPSAYNILFGSLAGGSLANLQASDNVYMSFSSTSDGMVEIEFSGTISGHLSFLQVDLEVHSSYPPPAGVYQVCELSAYNWQTEAYETTGPMYNNRAIGTTDVHIYLYGLLGNRKYVSSTGQWKVKVKCATSNAQPFTLYLDYLCFRSVCFQLGTTQTTTYRTNDTFVNGTQVGIRVWGIKADETEEEITAGSPVAVVTGPSATVTLSATWNCPATVQYVAYFIIVYLGVNYMRTGDLTGGGLPLLFMTEDLNVPLVAATWTVYYAFYYSTTLDQTFFRFGTTTYNSRMANFTYGVPPVVKIAYSDGLVCVMTAMPHLVTFISSQPVINEICQTQNG